MTTDTLEFPPWSMVKTVILGSNSWSNQRLTILTTENMYFGHGQNQYFFGSISCQNFRLTIWQFDTSPTQGWGKVGARSWARSGQGWGKVWTKGKVRARSGQARSGQGSGKVRARLGQGPDKKQGSGKVGAKRWSI